MAFGYALLKGRGKAAGYVRETGGKREVSVRDLPPFASCCLYAAGESGYQPCGNVTADGGGNAKWTAAKGGALFVSSGNKVLLWEGGDEAFLRACAWLNGQGRSEKGKSEPEAEEKKEEPPEERMETRADSENDPAYGEAAPVYPFERGRPSFPEGGQMKENPPERAYSLRPAGKGEPVDTLPERGEL